MNWKDYQKLVEMKIVETKQNLEHTEKEYKTAKIAYDSALREHADFEKAMDELIDKTGRE